MTKKSTKTKYILFYQDEIERPQLYQVVDELSKIKEPKEEVEIDLIMTSGGGTSSIAFQIARLIRERCSLLRGVVPHYAKSAATLLLLSADEIIMGEMSELGPLDSQMEHPSGGKFISALDYVGSLAQLRNLAILEIAMDAAVDIGLKARKYYYLSRLDSLKIGLDFAENYLTPLVSQLDPILLTQSYRKLEEAQQYGIQLLKDYMFLGDENELKASEIAGALVTKYKTHEFVIDIQEARQLGLKVIHDSNYPYRHIVWEITKQLLFDQRNIIRLWNQVEFKASFDAGGVENDLIKKEVVEEKKYEDETERNMQKDTQKNLN